MSQFSAVCKENVFAKLQTKKSAGRAQTLPRGRSAVSSQKLEIVKPAEKAMLSIAPATKPYACGTHGWSRW